jgi:adenylosuccinate lyase
LNRSWYEDYAKEHRLAINTARLLAISPIDGRYGDKTSDLTPYFSEAALIQQRIRVEIEYLISLSEENPKAPDLTSTEKSYLRSIYQSFSLDAVNRVVEIEKTRTNHDVKAVEYYIVEELEKIGLSRLKNFVHIYLTSEDVNNICYSNMWQEALREVIIPTMQATIDGINDLALATHDLPLLGLTHGQPATTTTFGHEMGVHSQRLQRQLDLVKNMRYDGKFGGAVGVYAENSFADPDFDWLGFAGRFVGSFDLDINYMTSQIVPADSLINSYNAVSTLSTILMDFSQDLWLYISNNALTQEVESATTGSSVMPQKINPIWAENSFGNNAVARIILQTLGNLLGISALQRDLSGSTEIRNQGVPLGHLMVALKNLTRGLRKVSYNVELIKYELSQNWSVVSAGVNSYLRSMDYAGDPYDELKAFCRGKTTSRETMQDFIRSLNIDQPHKDYLLTLDPVTYTGHASELTLNYLASQGRYPSKSISPAV